MASLAPGAFLSPLNPIASSRNTRISVQCGRGIGYLSAGSSRSLKLGSILVAAAAADPDTSAAAAKSDDYNRAMQRQMRNPYEYHHDLGMHFTVIEKNLIVGSQPQCKEDITRLYEEEGVRAILNLQQDKDVEYWGIDLPAIMKQCASHGIAYFRIPARDFDPNSLRNELPRAVAALESAISSGSVYVHCTAGLGRSPAVAIAYLYWFCDMDMNTAYSLLTSKRPCGPKKEAIRGATYDLANDDPFKLPLEKLPEDAFTDVSEEERRLIQQRVRKLR
ncbi:phosphoglucan phosphatase LSF2, chloroplastic [Selaginella moellendorffii]|nr:phosphoglucan phosphatase LSF2, chloroplastic [Selaginella moellendorffii]|eukprot:XP_002983714.2 phosphoglucan phosphatase LSF2, chloroplastic [Selaginella moellendorffii]